MNEIIDSFNYEDGHHEISSHEQIIEIYTSHRLCESQLC